MNEGPEGKAEVDACIRYSREVVSIVEDRMEVATPYVPVELVQKFLVVVNRVQRSSPQHVACPATSPGTDLKYRFRWVDVGQEEVLANVYQGWKSLRISPFHAVDVSSLHEGL